MIELKELTLGYGQRTLLEMVNARMTGGQLIALLGRNGAGKSTLLRIISGVLHPDHGHRFIASGTVGGEERPESDVESGGIQASSF